MIIVPINCKNSKPPETRDVIFGITVGIASGVVLGLIIGQWIWTVITGFGVGLLVAYLISRFKGLDP